MDTTLNNTVDTTPTPGLMVTGSKTRGDSTGVTEFLHDAPVISQTSRLSATPLTTQPIRDQSLSDFFARPYEFRLVNWTTSYAANDQLWAIDLSDFLTYTPWANKLQGFSLFRGTAVIRIVMNANPFQQGRLIMDFVPLYTSKDEWRHISLSQVTQHPNVELDCRNTTAVLRIPYATPYDYHPFVENNSQPWGRVTLSVLSPLKTGPSGETGVNVTAYVTFEDVEFAGPVPHPQSGYSVPPKPNRPPLRAKPSGAKDMERTAASRGGISSILLSASKISEAAEGIPLLSTVAKKATWLTRGAAAASSWFGWSKPLVDEPAGIVVRRVVPNMACSTGTDTSAHLALFHDNAVHIGSGASMEDVDEMSFEYLKQIPAFYVSGQWTDSQAAGTVLFDQVFNPQSFYSTCSKFYSGGNFAALSYPPFAYLSRFFRLWRGSINLHFKFIKTDYHSGRVEFIFDPTGASPTGSFDPTFALREIVDIRNQSEVVVTLPYLKSLKYLQTNGGVGGRLIVRVLNQLKHPETASSSVEVVVFVSAGPDFELQVPGNSTEFPTFVPQVGDDIEVQKPVEVVVGGYNSNGANHEVSAECIGEHFTSIKQLISRYTPTNDASNTVSATLGIYPFAFNLPYTTEGPTEVQFPPLRNDALSQFAGGYAMFKGGVKLVLGPFAGTDDCAAIANLPNLCNAGATVVDSGIGNGFITGDSGIFLNLNASVNGLSAYQFYDSNTNIYEVSAPYYCQTHYSKTRVCEYNDVLATEQDSPNSYLLAWFPDIATNTKITVMRSAADHFGFSYFIGFPLALQTWTPA